VTCWSLSARNISAALTRLLTAASHDREDLRLEDFRPEQIRWAVETGLGPWLRLCTRGVPRAATSPLWPLVQGADLTARVIMGEQIDALRRVAGDKVAARIRRAPDELVQRIVSGWAERLDAKRARDLGFKAETSFDDIVRAHIEDELGGKIAN